MKRFAIFDIDHTLSDSTWRDKFLNSHRLDCQSLRGMTEEEWIRYHRDCYQDPPNKAVVQLAKALAHTHHILIMTARPVEYSSQTIRWLAEHRIPWQNLHMRPSGNKDPSPVLKLSFAEPYLRLIDYVFDDHPEVIEAFKKIGVNAFLVQAAMN